MKRLCSMIVAILLAMVACSPGVTLVDPYCIPSAEAVLLIEDLAAGSAPTRLKAQTPMPRREFSSFTMNGRTYQADFYRGASGSPRAGVLMVPGVAQRGKDDPRLVGFANSLARVGFAVLVPDFANVRNLKVQPGDVDEVSDAFEYLVSRPDLAPQGRAGISAHSYAVGPAILAAMKPQLRDRVRFVQGVGGYYDIRSVITFFTTGYFRAPGDKTWRHLKPDPYGKWVFVLSNAERLAEPSDQTTLTEMARRRLADGQAPIDDLVTRLGSEGRALYALLENTDPNRTQDLISQLPTALRSDLEALNPADKDIHLLRARLILVHGKDDATVPYTESESLDQKLPARQVRLFLLHGLAHVDILGQGILDRWHLSCAAEALLAERWLGPR